MYLDDHGVVAGQRGVPHNPHECSNSNSRIELIQLYTAHGNQHLTRAGVNCSQKQKKLADVKDYIKIEHSEDKYDLGGTVKYKAWGLTCSLPRVT